MKSLWSTFTNGNHSGVLSIAVPMILSNITVPLLGLVDAAVIGHLEHAGYLGGVAAGGIMINVVLWLFGFLRMATTGISAQAHGANNKKKQAKILLQAAILALLFSLIILLVSKPLAHLVLSFSEASTIIKTYAQHYFLIRVISCPAALINLVFMGWLLGAQQAHKVMRLLVLINLVNIVLDIIFVPGLKMGVQGAAIASVIADYFGFVVGLYFVHRTWMANNLPRKQVQFAELFEDVFNLLKLNLDIFIRSLFLQAVFSFMTFKGATFGDHVAAANAILMNFLLLVSYLMDGFAYTMEALMGRAIGAKDRNKLQTSLVIVVFWSLVISCICTLLFTVFGKEMIHFMSSISSVRTEASIYLPWLIVFPILSMWSFLLDGLCVGATLGREMRNGMIIAFLVYFISFSLLHGYGNHGLWASMLIFMTVRWVALGYILKSTKTAELVFFAKKILSKDVKA